MNITLIQADLVWNDPAANRNRFEREIFAVGETDLVVLPEMFPTGFCTRPREAAEPDGGPTLAWMRRTARKKGAALAGSVAVEQDGRYFNRFYFVRPDGATVHYDKRHLFTYGGEHKEYTGGDRRVIAEYKGWRILLQVCYDLRFPVWSRNRDDYDMILYVASWPTPRVEAWSALRSLYPNVDNIAFLSDNTYGGISLQALVKQEMSSHPDLTLTLIDGRNGEKKAYAAIERLPRKSVLLIGTWRVGQDGQYFMDNSLKTLLADQPHLPVFSVSGSGIGSGAIGGYIPKYENGASEIAGQIADFYKKKPRAVHFDPTENEYRFDLQKLKEFGIAEYKLPSGSIVVDTVEARLQKYESYILILIVIFIVLSLFIAFLYYLYYRNKKLKISLENRGRELIAAKEKAEESDMLKSAFLANMSHEIRTPLNAIVGFSALLGDESISEEDRNVYMGIVNQNSDLLLTLIGDILDISRLETGKISFTLHPENIVAICQQVISTTAHGRKKDVECVFNPPVESFILKTDSQRLSQVLINLLTNASKFTEKGTIALAFEIQKEQRRILFSVSDTGCGIPRERQERVFNRFEKLNEFKQGTGLGLAICKQIVLRFGGNIWIDPEYTEGARFVFSHPIVP